MREIEHDIIFDKLGGDPRILCCLNRGCYGSTKLLNKPFESHLLNQQLNDMNKLFCKIIIKSNKYLCISSLFKYNKNKYIKYAKKNQWILSNNNNDNGALLGYIYHFANKEMKNKLSNQIINNYSIKYIEFDWRLSIHKSSKKKKRKHKKKHKEENTPHKL